jgi:hypothetical protein
MCSPSQLVRLLENLLAFHTFYKCGMTLFGWDSHLSDTDKLLLANWRWWVKLYLICPCQEGNGQKLQKIHQVFNLPLLLFFVQNSNIPKTLMLEESRGYWSQLSRRWQDEASNWNEPISLLHLRPEYAQRHIIVIGIFICKWVMCLCNPSCNQYKEENIYLNLWLQGLSQRNWTETRG